MSGLPPDPPRDPATPPTSGSYGERYAGTPWGSANAPAEPPKIAPRPAGFSCLRLLVTLVGLFWLVPAIISIVTVIAIGSAGEFEGVSLTSSLRTALLIAVLSNVFWAAFGLKLILAPGRTSLGCSALLGFVYSLIFAALLGLVIQFHVGTPLLYAVLAVPLAIYLLVMMISLLGRTSWE